MVAQSVKHSLQVNLCLQKLGLNSEFETYRLQVIPFSNGTNSQLLIIMTLHLTACVKWDGCGEICNDDTARNPAPLENCSQLIKGVECIYIYEQYMNNVLLNKQYDTKFLGVILSSNLKWNKHIDIVVNKVSKNIGIIAKVRHLLPQTLTRNLYFTLVHPLYQLLQSDMGFPA